MNSLPSKYGVSPLGRAVDDVAHHIEIEKRRMQERQELIRLQSEMWIQADVSRPLADASRDAQRHNTMLVAR